MVQVIKEQKNSQLNIKTLLFILEDIISQFKDYKTLIINFNYFLKLQK